MVELNMKKWVFVKMLDFGLFLGRNFRTLSLLLFRLKYICKALCVVELNSTHISEMICLQSTSSFLFQLYLGDIKIKYFYMFLLLPNNRNFYLYPIIE